MIVVVDRDYRYLIANQAFLDYHGLRREEVVGHPVSELVGPQTFEKVTKNNLDECFRGRIVKCELGLSFAKLGRRDIRGSYFPIEGPSGIDQVAVVLQDVTERQRADRELQRSFAALRALTAQLQSVREEERTRLARELHDRLGQALTAIRIDLAALKSAPARDRPSPRIDAILGLVDETIRAVRKISTELRPGILDDLGLVAAVEWAAEEFQARTGIQCQVGLPEVHPAVDAGRATALFRILQETLTNVARHAGATQVSIALSQDSGRLSLEVRDNGRGIAKDQLSAPGSLGILGMRERAALLGGEFTIAGDPASGTTVRVAIPIGDNRPPEGKP
jgi:PAS domain S-box-containing protein